MKSKTRRRRPSEVKKDKYAYEAVQNIEGYKPSDPEASIEALDALVQLYQTKQKVEAQKEGEFKAARDNTVEAEYAFHQAIQKVKNQVKAQFGDDSNELQSLGLKKKSEYKTPKRTTK